MRKKYEKIDTRLKVDFGGMINPNSIDTEVAVLGTLLLYNKSILNIITLLSPDDFYSERHQVIYSSIISVYKKGSDVTTLNVVKELRSTGEIEFCGGASYIVGLSNKAYNGDLKEIALHVLELSKKRQLVELGTNVTYKAYQDTQDVFELIDELQHGVMDLLTLKFSKETNFLKLAVDTYKDLSNRLEGVVIGVPSKYNQINKNIGAYRLGSLITIAGRPGMGKSLFLVNEAYFQASQNYRVLIFSLEMPSSEVVTRIFSLGTQIESYKFDKNNLSNDERLVVEKFIEKSFHKNIYIDDTGSIDMLYLVSQIKKIKLLNENKNKDIKGLDIVYIDYLQLMKLGGENRNEGLGEITRALKSLAKELEISIVIFSQLNRAVETRAGFKRPQLSDLKESGSIEEDSDVVLFLYRAEYYGITQNDNGDSTAGEMEVIISKNRQGGKDDCFLRFLPTISTILESKEYLETPNYIGSFEQEKSPTTIPLDKIDF